MRFLAIHSLYYVCADNCSYPLVILIGDMTKNGIYLTALG